MGTFSQEPMGEGRNPEKEIIGWSNKEQWDGIEESDVGLEMPRNRWKKKPKDRFEGDPLVRVGKTSKKKIPIFLSEADGDALALALALLEKEEKGKNE